MYAAGGVPPEQVLPLALDVGCNTQQIRDDYLYMGERQVRLPYYQPVQCTRSSATCTARQGAAVAHPAQIFFRA